MTRYSKFKVAGLFFLIIGIVFNYSIAFGVDNSETSDTIIADTIKFNPLKDGSTAKSNFHNDSKMTKSPAGAVWRSIIFPGWGQYYVESYWKIPIFTGGVLASAYFIWDNQSKYNKKKKEIEDYLSLDENNKDNYIHNVLKNQREVYRDNRDISIFVLAGFYIASTIDAYVGAHLFDFNVSDDLGMSIQPNYYNNSIGINFTLKFK